MTHDRDLGSRVPRRCLPPGNLHESKEIPPSGRRATADVRQGLALVIRVRPRLLDESSGAAWPPTIDFRPGEVAPVPTVDLPQVPVDPDGDSGVASGDRRRARLGTCQVAARDADERRVRQILPHLLELLETARAEGNLEIAIDALAFGKTHLPMSNAVDDEPPRGGEEARL